MKRKNTFSRKGLLASFGAVFMVVCFMAGYLAAAQPHMQAALKNLQAAKDHLQKATHDKGGHRARAIKLVNDAIAEVKKGIEADK